MKEPFFKDRFGKAYPFSEAPIYGLSLIVGGKTTQTPDENGDPTYIPEFNRIYAARLLRERGLCGL